MSKFLSAWLNTETHEVVCADTLRHRDTRDHMWWSSDDLACWRAWTWTGPSEDDLTVWVHPDDPHDANWYRSLILTRYGGDWMRAVADCGRQAVERRGRFQCSGNQAIEVIPDLPGCRELYCYECPELQSLPELPECRELYCWDCSELRSLPKLPACQELICYDCSELRFLPELPECRELYCWDCSELRSLPDLPACQELICSFCPELRELPKVPDNCEIIRD